MLDVQCAMIFSVPPVQSTNFVTAATRSTAPRKNAESKTVDRKCATSRIAMTAKDSSTAVVVIRAFARITTSLSSVKSATCVIAVHVSTSSAASSAIEHASKNALALIRNRQSEPRQVIRTN